MVVQNFTQGKTKMGYKIKEIVLDDELFSRYEIVSNGEEESKETKKLRNLSKINIFIGANNSGKSRFLRNLFQKQLQFIPAEFDLAELNQIILACQHDLKKAFDDYRIIEYGEIQAEVSHYQPVKSVFPNAEFLRPLLDGVDRLLGTQENASYRRNSGLKSNVDTKLFAQNLNTIGQETQTKLKQLPIELSRNTAYSFERVYIPTLRGLRPFSAQEGLDQYKQKTKEDYFSKADHTEGGIFSGLLLNQSVKIQLLGRRLEREVITSYQNFLSQKFFNNDPVTLIPSLDKNVLTVRIGDEEMPIFELGDGIQAIINLTYPLFINQNKNLLVFIEEPELFLHPGLQRVFIETLLDPRFDNFQYFIATHSNHFLDITLDVDNISVYTFKKFFKDETGDERPAYFQIENVNNEDTNVLDLIGVKNSSVFLSNCTIWVEGITDRYFLRKYLEVYQKSLGEEHQKFREDTHYSFVEYSGGNITHWSFLDDEEGEEIHQPIAVERICRRIFLISDRDNGKEKRHEKLKAKLGENNYYCLECREIENLLSADVLKKVIAEYEGVEVSELQFKLELTEANYRNDSLGISIDENLLDKKRRGSYASESGTVSDKVNFCKKTIHHINKLEDLSEEAKMLCVKIYAFVKANNP